MITKSATDPTTAARPMRFTRDARSAWAGIIKTASPQRTPTILLPAYIGYTDREGSGVFDPVEATSARAEFCAVRNDLSVDMDQFVTSVRSGRVTIALIIHYFGFCRNDMVAIARECKANNVTLVEDCAHVLGVDWSNKALGSFGDFAFYSVHKQIAVETGGIVRWNATGFNAESFAEVPAPPYGVVEQFARVDFDYIAQKRRANFARYVAELPAGRCAAMFCLRDGDVPQTFPIRVQGEKERERLYFALMNQGMPTIALYYRLIPQIERGAFPLAHVISDEILNLPVHQDIDEADIHRLCAAIREHFEEPRV